MNRHKVNKAFVDIINSIDLYKGYDFTKNKIPKVYSFDKFHKVDVGIEKQEEDYTYGEYGKLKENEGDLYKMAIVPGSVNNNPTRKKGINRYQIIVNVSRMDEEFYTILFYQKYKHRCCMKLHTKTNIKKILDRDTIINNILEYE